MITIKLVPPTEKCRESFVRGLREFRNEGLPWWIGGDLEAVEQDFAAFVATKLADAHRRTETFVPATHLWALAEETFAGRISIRHDLNDALRAVGGHIGYDVVPCETQKDLDAGCREATECLSNICGLALDPAIAEAGAGQCASSFAVATVKTCAAYERHD